MFSGARKSREIASNPRLPVRSESMVFDVWHDIHGNGPQKYQKHIRSCRFSIWIPGKVENWEPRMLCFAVVFLVFWSTLPAFRSRMGPGPENLNPVRTPGCRFRCFPWKIASRNHQYSLGLIGILSAATTEFWSSKSTKYDNKYVGILSSFTRMSRNVLEKDQ